MITVRKWGHLLRRSNPSFFDLYEKGLVMALAMLRAPPSDLEVRLRENYSPTALYGHHPMFSCYYAWIKAHLQTVDFGYKEVMFEQDFMVKVPYIVPVDCVNIESFMFSQEVQVAMSVLCEGGRVDVAGIGIFPWGYSVRELFPAFGAGILASSRQLQDEFVAADVFGDTDATEAVAKSIFILDCEVLLGEPTALQTGSKELTGVAPFVGQLF